MIDLHCHIVDNLSCGPESFDESLAMCRMAIKDGVRMIVATPRWEEEADSPPISASEFYRKLQCLQSETGGSLSFKSGYMMRFSPHLPELVERYGQHLTLGGGRHLLVSLPSLRIPSEAEEVWSALCERGLSVVLAEPECSHALRRSPARLDGWLGSGLMLQISAASLLGRHGREALRFAEHCLKAYETSVVVASNSRGARDQRSSLGEAHSHLVRKLGAARAGRLFHDLPRAILNGQVNNADGNPKPRRPLDNLLGLFRPKRSLTSILDT